MQQKEHRLLRGLTLLVRRYFAHGVGHDSAALTYYLLFAIFPLLIFFSNLLGLFAEDAEALLRELSPLIPADAFELLRQYLASVSKESRTTLLGFSLVFSVYFPMRAATSLLSSVRKAYGVEKPTHFLRYQAKVLLYTIFLILTLILSLALMTVGTRVLNLIAGYIYISAGFIRLWNGLRFALLGLVVFLAIIALYALAQEKRTIHYLWPGVLASLTAWMLSSLLFSLYVENVGRYSVIYGALGAIVVLLLWLRLTATTLILGAEFNSVLMELRGVPRPHRQDGKRYRRTEDDRL